MQSVQTSKTTQRFYDDDELPKLVLALVVYNIPTPNYVYKFTEPNKWLQISHQTAGHGCHQHKLWVRKLQPKTSTISKNIKVLNDRWLDSDCGIFGVSLTEANNYNEDLQRLFGVHCNHQWSMFEEGIYPIDCTEEHLKAMTDTKLPKDLDDMLIFSSSISKLCGSINRWNLLILGQNCD